MRKRRFSVSLRRGFSILELLISVAILATLAAIAAPRFIRARYSAYFSVCMSNERMMATALEAYRVGSSVYPSSLDLLLTDGHLRQLPVCPSVPQTGRYDYEVTADYRNFTVSCKNGVHEFQLSPVADGFPQYVNGQGVKEFP